MVASPCAGSFGDIWLRSDPRASTIVSSSWLLLSPLVLATGQRFFRSPLEIDPRGAGHFGAQLWERIREGDAAACAPSWANSAALRIMDTAWSKPRSESTIT